MTFQEERKKQLMMVLIIASALIPIYLIYSTFGLPSIGVSIFLIIYSFFITLIWFLYYFDFFKKKPIFNGTNGQPTIEK